MARTKKYLDGRAIVTVKHIGSDYSQGVKRANYAISLTVDGTPVFTDLEMSGLEYPNKRIADNLIEDALCFMTLRPGDTDQEYFDKYTPEQLTWANSFDCEYMAGEVRG